MRRYDLDWLRVIVFGLLIFYHVGMFFVPWEWHLKNNHLYSWLEYPMLFINQWRLPILFVISGMGTSYALSKRTGLQFAKERIKRLLLPLIFGILVIVPPQIFLERLSKGEFTGTYLQFLSGMFSSGLYPQGNLSWHHLWFLPYLLSFSLFLTPLLVFLKRNPENILIITVRKVLSNPLGFLWFAVPLLLTELFLKPYYPQTFFFINDWFTIGFNILLFIYGFIFISTGNIFWKNVSQHRGSFLASGILSFALLLLIKLKFPTLNVIEAIVSVLNTGSWVLALFGYAAKHLNKSNDVLSYANKAVYPFYILHQTVIMGIAFLVKDQEWGLFFKFSLMLVATFGITLLVYDRIILKIRFLQPLFGIKAGKKKSKEEATIVLQEITETS
ncbi:MAG: acyltransferase family protein [Salinimicrobium sp.]